MNKEKVVPYPSVIIKGEYVYCLTKDGQAETYKKRIGRKLELVEMKKTLESKERKYGLRIYTKDGVEVIEDVSRSILVNKDDILSTVSYGSDVNGDNYKVYMMSLRNQEEAMETELSHQGVGWDYLGEDLIFKHEGIISQKEISSQYSGDLLLETKGTVEEFKDFLESEVVGYTPLEAALGMGLSAVVIGLLEEYKSNLIQIYGKSTTGKTTVGELIVSLATKPSLEKEGLMMTWNSTQNALIGKLSDINALAVLIDDSSISKLKDFTNLIYQLESGREKNRMNKEARLRKVRTWKTSIISNGESSLLDNANQNEGLKVRLQEFGNVSWTKSAEHSDRIKAKVQEVYGHGVVILAKELIKLEEEEIRRRLLEIEEEGKEKLKKAKKYNHLSDRILKNYSTMVYSLEVFAAAIKLDINHEAVKSFYIKHMFIDERAMWEIALEKLLQYIESNIGRFNKKIKKSSDSKSYITKEATNYGEFLGVIEDVEVIEGRDKNTKDRIKILKKEIVIIEEKFYEIMKELGFTNPKGILRDWKEENLLNCEKDRYYRKRKVSENGLATKVIILKMQEKYQVVEKDNLQCLTSNFGTDESKIVSIEKKMSAEDIHREIEKMSILEDNKLNEVKYRR